MWRVRARARAPSLGVTFDLRPLPLPWPGRGPSVLLMRWRTHVGTVWLEEKLSVCERLLIVWKWTCFTHAGSGGMSSIGVDQVVLYHWHCLFNGPPWGTGWCCCGSVLPPPIRPHWVHTSGSNCCTPAAEWVTSFMWFTSAPPPISPLNMPTGSYHNVVRKACGYSCNCWVSMTAGFISTTVHWPFMGPHYRYKF